MTMQQYLLPVWGDSRFVAAAKDAGMAPDSWWDQPPWNYGHALISYVHWKKAFQFPKDAYIFGDSGGFTLRSPSRVEKIDPLDVLQWQASLCTVGCVLDLPPKGIKQRVWAKGLQVTINHTERALPSYRRLRAEGSAFRWWGVLHGNNEAEVRQYHDAISAVYPFTDAGEGWAIRAEPNVNIYAVARSLRILKNLGITRAHFLAATSQNVIAVLLALGPLAGLELLTYDSAYAVKSGFNRHTFIPNADGLTFRVTLETGSDRRDREWCLHECPCAVCAHMRMRSEVYPKGMAEVHAEKFGGWWSTWLQFHDLHIQEQLTAVQARAALDDPDRLLRTMLTPNEYSLVMRIFEEDGHEPNAIPSTGSSNGLLDYL